MWKQYFKTPFTNGFDCYILDADGHPIANFLNLSKGSYNRVVDCLNGDYIQKGNVICTVSDDYTKILMNDVPVLLIRGWGYLTGVGGCNLSPEKATEVQNSLSDFICEKLNRK